MSNYQTEHDELQPAAKQVNTDDLSDSERLIQEQTSSEYKYGFVTDIEQEFAPKGLNEDIVRFISAKKDEPEWMLEWRLKAFRHWQKMEVPEWPNLDYPAIDFQEIIYYAAHKPGPKYDSLDEVDPELLRTYER
ncbi:MAG: Fe-S cluster assembly protein SufB, partial [Limisphaerales bacterium]